MLTKVKTSKYITREPSANPNPARKVSEVVVDYFNKVDSCVSPCGFLGFTRIFEDLIQNLPDTNRLFVTFVPSLHFYRFGTACRHALELTSP